VAHAVSLQTAQANVPAAKVYKREIQKAYTQYGMRTVLALGGWTYRNDFAFLTSMTPAQLTTWAQSVWYWYTCTINCLQHSRRLYLSSVLRCQTHKNVPLDHHRVFPGNAGAVLA
jgi:hypothetical protein